MHPVHRGGVRLRQTRFNAEDPECHVVLADFGSACKITEQTRLADQVHCKHSLETFFQTCLKSILMYQVAKGLQLGPVYVRTELRWEP